MEDTRTIYAVSFVDADGGEELFNRLQSQTQAMREADRAKVSEKRKGRPVGVSKQQQYRNAGGRWIDDGSEFIEVFSD